MKEREELIEKQKDLSKNYVEVLYDFMKDRQYSEIFESKLKPMLEKAEYVDKKEEDWDATCSNKVMELRKKIPQTADTLKAEEPVVLKRKAISTSERDGGWCTFYDAEKSYEVDAHTEVYTVCVAKTNGTIEMSDKSNRIIPAGCPVILHLNTQLEDGTYRAEIPQDALKPFIPYDIFFRAARQNMIPNEFRMSEKNISGISNGNKNIQIRYLGNKSLEIMRFKGISASIRKLKNKIRKNLRG